MNELIKEAKKCKSCVDWTHHCKAECCKVVYLNVNPITLKMKGKYIIVKKPILKDTQWYYKLRGVRYIRGELRFPKEHCVGSGDEVLYIKKCKLLEGFKCKGHPDNKPDMCKNLSKESFNDTSVRITPNCMFRYQQMEEI